MGVLKFDLEEELQLWSRLLCEQSPCPLMQPPHSRQKGLANHHPSHPPDHLQSRSMPQFHPYRLGLRGVPHQHTQWDPGCCRTWEGLAPAEVVGEVVPGSDVACLIVGCWTVFLGKNWVLLVWLVLNSTSL